MFEYSPCENYLENVKAITRCALVAITICSWIAVTNHCAFAAATKEIANAQSECPFHSKPAKPKEQSSQMQCCKILRGVIFAQSKGWQHDDTKFSDANFSAEMAASLACSLRTVASLSLDTGPPLRSFSFAELILQQSLLANAPPLVA